MKGKLMQSLADTRRGIAFSRPVIAPSTHARAEIVEVGAPDDERCDDHSIRTTEFGHRIVDAAQRIRLRRAEIARSAAVDAWLERRRARRADLRQFPIAQQLLCRSVVIAFNRVAIEQLVDRMLANIAHDGV